MDPAVVVAAHTVLGREGLARILADHAFDVVARSGDAKELVELAAELRPALVVIEGRLPPTRTDEHLRAAMQIRAESPQVGVLMLCRTVDLGLAGQMLARGTDRIGWLLKDRISDVAQVAEAARIVAGGGSMLDPVFVSQLLARRDESVDLGRLTARERGVLELMAEGRSNLAIAHQLVVTQRAVEKHVANVFDKLALPADADDHRRVLAVLRYLAQ